MPRRSASLLLWAACCAAAACSSDRNGDPPINGPGTPDAGTPNLVDGSVLVDGAVVIPDGGPLPNPDGGTVTPDGGPDMCMNAPRKPRPPNMIVNGTRSPTLVPLAPEQVNAVVGLGFEGGAASCSGTLIADQVVLTAAHCTEGVGPSSIDVLFGQDDESPDLSVPVTQIIEHPDVDTSLLRLQFAPSTQIAVRPIPIYLGTLTAADIGRTVEQAGYGQTGGGNTNGRFFVTETLDDLDSELLTVDGMGIQGVCFGDSGGPSMLVAPEGDARVIGDLSFGDATCADRDNFVRADMIRPWIEQTTGPTPTAGPVPCGTVTVEGSCSGDQRSATWCEGAELQRAICDTQDVCGWSTTASGWRCLPRASDPCGGMGLTGICASGSASWCQRGQILSRPCEACGETCLYLGTGFGYDCSTDPVACGNLDYLGHCNGDVSEWCNEDGTRESEDCSIMGQVCRYVDSDIGYYCDDP